MAYTDESINISGGKRSEIIGHLLQRFDYLKGQREFFNPEWDDITEFVLPNSGDFANKRSLAQLRDRRVFDSTGRRANEQLATILKDGIAPAHEMWGKIATKDPRLKGDDLGIKYFDIRNTILYDFINHPASNFHSALHETFLQTTAYGTGCLYIDMHNNFLRFKPIHLSELYITEDAAGLVDTVFRHFLMTPRQAAQQWGVEKLSHGCQNLLRSNPDEKIHFLHCVKPNDDYDGMKVGKMNLPFCSYYIDIEGNHLIDAGGYHEMPYKVTRWEKFIGEDYGRSPAWGAMPDIMMVNAIKQSIIKATQKAADPMYLLADDGVVLPLDTRPGGVTFGGVDPVSGRQRVQVLSHQGDLTVAYKLLEDTRQDIRHAFFFEPLSSRNTDRMTATVAMELKEERLLGMGPQAGRIQVELMSPTLQRADGLLARAGKYPKVNDQLAEMIEKGGFDITYTSPLFNTQRRQESLALQRTLQAVLPIAQFDPTVLDNFDGDYITRDTSLVQGLPAPFLKSIEARDAQRAERMQQQQQMEQQAQQMANAEMMSKLSKSGGAPNA